jgi:hypothetical protein
VQEKESTFHPALPTATFVKSDDSRILKGLKGVNVIVEPLQPDLKSIGLTSDKVQTSVELTLRRNGIRVLSPQEQLDYRGMPAFYVSVIGSKTSYSFSVSLLETTRLERNPYITFLGTVWYEYAGGQHGGDSEYVANHVVRKVEMFCNDYLKANPKN